MGDAFSFASYSILTLSDHPDLLDMVAVRTYNLIKHVGVAEQADAHV